MCSKFRWCKLFSAFFPCALLCRGVAASLFQTGWFRGLFGNCLRSESGTDRLLPLAGYLHQASELIHNAGNMLIKAGFISESGDWLDSLADESPKRLHDRIKSEFFNFDSDDVKCRPKAQKAVHSVILHFRKVVHAEKGIRLQEPVALANQIINRTSLALGSCFGSVHTSGKVNLLLSAIAGWQRQSRT